MCAPHATPLCTIMRVRARMFGKINFGNLVKNSPIRQIKIPTKVSGYTVCATSHIISEHFILYKGQDEWEEQCRIQSIFSQPSSDC